MTQTTTDLILTDAVVPADPVDGDAPVHAVEVLQPTCGRPV